MKSAALELAKYKITVNSIELNVWSRSEMGWFEFEAL